MPARIEVGVILSPMFHVRPVQRSDTADWLRMRREFWPDGSESEHATEIEEFFGGSSGEPAAAFMAEDGESRVVGLAELSIRPCAEGCRTHRVAYLEGWYVAPEARRLGAGRALVQAAEKWALAQGCSEFASDTRADNESSAAAHLALGFSDAGLIRCFRKDLPAIKMEN